MAKYEISGIQFNNKKEITTHIQNILRRYETGENLQYNDQKFMYDLLQRHNEVDKKIGVGIDYIRKVKNDWGKHAFEIVRIDGSETDFSFMKCITQKGEFQDHRAACRTTIRNDIQKFRYETYSLGEVICPITGENVPIENSHVDHKPPNTFDYIFRQWVTNNINAKIGGYDDGEQHKYFIDSEVGENFRELHNQLAELRVTSARGNLSRLEKMVEL
jgi:hypothetical protein